MYKLHQYQTEILRKLSKVTALKFNQILLEGLKSEHTNYHLKKLVELGYIRKEKNTYTLTNTGKDFVGMLDDNKDIVEKQPKVSILLNIKSRTEEGTNHLLCKRLKQPYLGKVGRLTGKVRFGESISEAAERELYEETGLKSTNTKVKGVYHKIRKDTNSQVVQDNVFFIVDIINPTGDLIKQSIAQENFWITKNELENSKELDLFDSLVLEDDDTVKDNWFTESIALSQGY